jgi:hypothetical protein
MDLNESPEDAAQSIDLLRREIRTLPVATRANLLKELWGIETSLKRLHKVIVDVKESIDIVVGGRTFTRVPLSILSKQPGSMLWKAVQVHLDDHTTESLHFPMVQEEYFQYVLDILENKNTWPEIKTRGRMAELISQLEYFNITGTVSLIQQNHDQNKEEQRQREQHQGQLHSMRLANEFLPSTVLFKQIGMVTATRMGVYGLPLYRHLLKMDPDNYQRELDQVLTSEVIHDLQILSFGHEYADAATVPIAWPTLSIDVSVDWTGALLSCQYDVMHIAARIRTRYPTVKVSLYIHDNRVYIRVQPRNDDEDEPTFRQCCHDNDLVLLDETYVVHTTSCMVVARSFA